MNDNIQARNQRYTLKLFALFTVLINSLLFGQSVTVLLWEGYQYSSHYGSTVTQGDEYYHSSGITVFSFDQEYYFSNGQISEKYGDLIIDSDGTYKERFGDYWIDSDGAITEIIGDTYIHSDDKGYLIIKDGSLLDFLLDYRVDDPHYYGLECDAFFPEVDHEH